MKILGFAKASILSLISTLANAQGSADYSYDFANSPEESAVMMRPMSFGIGNILCEPFGIAGAAGYRLSSEIQDANHSGGVALDGYQKARYRPEFGSLVDEVKIYYEATMPDGSKFDFGNAKNFDYPTDGVTFGNKIYVVQPYSAGYKILDPLIGHELVHVAQWKRRGSSEAKFGHDYFLHWCEGGFDYFENKLEKSAREASEKYRIFDPSIVAEVETELNAPTGHFSGSGGGLDDMPMIEMPSTLR